MRHLAIWSLGFLLCGCHAGPPASPSVGAKVFPGALVGAQEQKLSGLQGTPSTVYLHLQGEGSCLAVAGLFRQGRPLAEAPPRVERLSSEWQTFEWQYPLQPGAKICVVVLPANTEEAEELVSLVDRAAQDEGAGRKIYEKSTQWSAASAPDLHILSRRQNLGALDRSGTDRAPHSGQAVATDEIKVQWMNPDDSAESLAVQTRPVVRYFSLPSPGNPVSQR